ncbi:MAG: hypothetical protein AABY53_03010 [Bdellovibrionota bacterium]
MKIFNCALFVVLLSVQAWAIEIVKVKDNKVLLDLEDATAAVNQKIYLLNSKGKKIAIATLIQVKGTRAIALINKGNANDAKSVQLVAASSSNAENTEEAAGSEPYRLSGMKYSVLGNILINNMSTKQADSFIPPNQENVALKGNSFGVTGAIDYSFKDLFIMRGTLGYEPFEVSGTSNFLSCNNLTSTTCTASIQYLSAGGYLRYNLTHSKLQWWIGGGGTGKFPIAKSTTALVAGDVKFTVTFAFAGGADYYTSNKNFIPLSLEYQLFQSSDTVTANILMLRAGYGWAF